MCGIAGFAGHLTTSVPRDTLLNQMVETLRRRGPDDKGTFTANDVGLGMRRLSIIDLEGGHQPISNEDGRVTVVCNGEIYNYHDLRKELIQKGHVFKTSSDVEVIVHLYEDFGLGFLDRLRGMFAIAIWDEGQKRLMVARDRVGIKPLFYSATTNGLAFASEIKALLATNDVDRSMNWRAMDLYFTYGYVPCPETIFQGIKKLPPGHYLLWEAGRLSVQKYWQLQFRPDRSRSENELAEQFLHEFRESIRLHLVSDVPVGCFLSGGVDSSLMVALMSQMSSSPVKTFTMGFGGHKGGYFDERSHARLVSQQYGTDHYEYEVDPHLDEIVDDIVSAFDEPFADDSVVPSFYICQQARREVKVALTGLGGDELFGGYERYLGLHVSQYYSYIPKVIHQQVITPLVNLIPERKDGHYTINHLKRFVRSADLDPAERYKSYVTVFDGPGRQSLYTSAVSEALRQENKTSTELHHFNSPYATHPLDRAMCLDIHTYLPDDILALSDRLSMWHSLELRVPFVDHQLMEFCATIPAQLKVRRGTKKYLLKKAARPLLTDDILNHRKQGFASPMSSWLRNDLKEYMRDSLSRSSVSRRGLFNPETIELLMQDHVARKESNEKKLFSLIMFAKWHEKYMEQQ